MLPEADSRGKLRLRACGNGVAAHRRSAHESARRSSSSAHMWSARYAMPAAIGAQQLWRPETWTFQAGFWLWNLSEVTKNRLLKSWAMRSGGAPRRGGVHRRSCTSAVRWEPDRRTATSSLDGPRAERPSPGRSRQRNGAETCLKRPGTRRAPPRPTVPGAPGRP